MHRAGEQLQPRRPRPRGAGEGRLHRRGRPAAGRHPRARSINALSQAWVDGQCAAHLPPRAQHRLAQDRWAAGDATSRAVRLALIALHRRDGLPVRADGAKTWGFYDVLFKGKPFKFQRRYGSYVMENVLFKISFPAEFHAQTAVECAMQLHPAQVQGSPRRHRAHRHPHARSRHPHHRQEGPAEQPRRPRPLHPVHGRRAAAARAA